MWIVPLPRNVPLTRKATTPFFMSFQPAPVNVPFTVTS
jgi:hypothetical protein